MPFYKVPAVASSADEGPRRIRAPLRHSVNGDGTAGAVATGSRDNDVIGDCAASADNSKLHICHADQVHIVINPLMYGPLLGDRNMEF